MDPIDLALLILRLTFGLFLAYHLYNKLTGGGGLAGSARWFGSIGARGGWAGAVTQLAVCYRADP